MKKFFYFLKKSPLLVVFLFCRSTLKAENADIRETPTVKATAKVLPSVVNIGTERIVSGFDSPWGRNDPFEGIFRDFFAGQVGRKETSLGSGAIINKEGLIVTNAHVVHKATRILVTTSDGKQYLAKEIASDDLNDIALLKLINYKGNPVLRPIQFAMSDQLLLGESVIAVGNPYGLGSTVTKGILSGWGRRVTYGGKVIFNDIIQTDAPINPGNSGGPLVNLNAEMIGLNTAIYEQARGIGFAIPLKRIERILAGWLIPERFSEVTLGIVPGVKKEGQRNIFYLKEVISDSPAWNADLRAGDIITSYNGHRILQLIGLSNKLWKLKGGTSIRLGLKEKGEKKLTVETLKSLDGKKLAEQKLGIGLQKLTLKLSEALGYPFHGGLIVNEVSQKERNIRRGDIIVKIGDVSIHDFKDLRRALSGKHYGDNVSTLVVFIVTRNKQVQIYKRNVILKIK